MNHLAKRQALVSTARLFDKTGLSINPAGNLSTRAGSGFLITPAAVAHEDLKPDDMVYCDLQEYVTRGDKRPSSELPFHRAIYQTRPNIQAIVHAHPPYATAIACTRQAIPAFHYMVAIAGGATIPCTDYAMFGSNALSRNIVSLLSNHNACLLANHGMIATGATITAAFHLARVVEDLAQQYCIASQIGTPVLLDDEQMTAVLDKIGAYDQQV